MTADLTPVLKVCSLDQQHQITSPGNLVAAQILRPCPDLLSQRLRVGGGVGVEQGPAKWFHRPSRWF